MEKFTPKKIDLSSINEGNKYKLGDGVQASAINSPIEAVAFAQDKIDKNTASINTILNILEQGQVFAIAENVENNEKTRVTGGEELSNYQIVSNEKTTVKKISGNTVNYEGVLKNAQISGIESKTYNLLPFPYVDGMSKTQWGITYTVNDDGSVWVDGTCTAPAGEFSIFTLTNSKLDYFSDDEPLIIRGAPQGSTKDTYFYYNVTTGHKGSYDTPMVKMQNKYGKYDIRVASGVTVNKVLFKPMLVRASDFSETPPYISQTIKSEMTLPQTIELAKWDYIEDGKINRYTKYYKLDDTYDWSMLEYANGNIFSVNLENVNQEDIVVAGFTPSPNEFVTPNDVKAGEYNSWSSDNSWFFNPSVLMTMDEWKTYLASNPIYVAVKSKEIIEVTDFNFSNNYVVWDKGIEKMSTPTDDSGRTCFDYGANPTISQDYLVLGGNS